MKYVPVISSSNKRLMPCHAARARELVRKKRAVRRFDRGLFYIQLLDRADGEVQEIAVGIDPGSKKEAITLKSVCHTFLNIQMDAKTWVRAKVEDRRNMRRARRFRRTPYRKCRYNRGQLRNQNRIPPSTRARWNWKLQVLRWLLKYYPVKTFIVEDIGAKTKSNQRKWNVSFSPLEVGKQWFYDEIRKLGHLETKKGYETAEERKKLGLKKIKNKLSNKFEAHCVDSWVLANWWIGGHIKPDNEDMLLMTPLNFYRRQLHMMQPAKGGIRKPYGGTISEGFKRGTWILHPKFGTCYVGGSSKGKISLHNIETGGRLTQGAKTEDCILLARCGWRACTKKGKKGASSPT